MREHNTLSIFDGKHIRKLWHNNEWWFSVIDVVAILTDQIDSLTARKYWNKLSQRLREEGSEVVTFCHQLKLPADDGKFRETDCANTEGIFRIIQSIPSKKAEPLKLWLAKVGYERVQEIGDPELAQKRMREIYKAKGYSQDWIEKRVRGIAVRDELTDEWKKRNVGAEREYAILTAEISKATFGMTPREYKEFKGLKKENLRDHMDDLELIFSMLGERVTTEITRTKEARGFNDCHIAAAEGGEVAGNARKDAEKKIGKSVVTHENYLNQHEKEKRKYVGMKKT